MGMVGDDNVIEMNACIERVVEARSIWLRKIVHLCKRQQSEDFISGMISVNDGVQRNHEKVTVYLKCRGSQETSVS